MATANNCNVPEELMYWVEQHIWVRPEDDGTLTIGMTDAAQYLAGALVTVTPKGVGKTVKKGRSAGTAESGKWVGPIRSPVTGEIVAVNDAAVSDPKIINRDPYGEGWFVRIRPDDWEADKADLLSGDAAVAAYSAFLKREGIDCSDLSGREQPAS